MWRRLGVGVGVDLGTGDGEEFPEKEGFVDVTLVQQRTHDSGWLLTGDK